MLIVDSSGIISNVAAVAVVSILDESDSAAAVREVLVKADDKALADD